MLQIIALSFLLGELMNRLDDTIQSYNWWFDTYPLEFAEFLLVTALNRGVWLHPLSANDLAFPNPKLDGNSGLFYLAKFLKSE